MCLRMFSGDDTGWTKEAMHSHVRLNRKITQQLARPHYEFQSLQVVSCHLWRPCSRTFRVTSQLFCVRESITLIENLSASVLLRSYLSRISRTIGEFQSTLTCLVTFPVQFHTCLWSSRDKSAFHWLLVFTQLFHCKAISDCRVSLNKGQLLHNLRTNW